jgi:hypothetical protein
MRAAVFRHTARGAAPEGRFAPRRRSVDGEVQTVRPCVLFGARLLCSVLLGQVLGRDGAAVWLLQMRTAYSGRLWHAHISGSHPARCSAPFVYAL